MTAPDSTFNNTASLTELSSHDPELWQQVIKNIRSSVEQKRFEQLADMSQKAQAVISRWLAAADSPLAKTQHAKEDFIRARMTILAVEQFISAFTQSNEQPSFSDRLQLRLGILRHLERGKVLTTAEFDKLWNQLRSPGAAATAIQKAGFWSVPTKEACEGILAYAKNRPILEIGAGRGLFVAALSQIGANIQGVDNCSWAMATNPIKSAKMKIISKSAIEALNEYRPEVVLSVWPPPGINFESDIFASPSVELYLTIVSQHRFATGNWSAYKLQESKPKGFSCISNEIINKSLRPVEAVQQIFIFRRK